MRTFDDLRFGQVKSFNNAPGRNFGWITVHEPLAGEPQEVWFHLHEGQYPHYNGETIKWAGFTSGLSQLREPRPGDFVVFAYDLDRYGRDKASPWTYADLFFEECIAATTEYFRILNGNVVIWEGSYSPYYETRLTGDPLPIEGFTTIQRLEADEVYDTPDGGGYHVPGEWRNFDDGEVREVYDQLITASRNPTWHSNVVPPLRNEYGARHQADRLFAEECASQVYDL